MRYVTRFVGTRRGYDRRATPVRDSLGRALTPRDIVTGQAYAVDGGLSSTHPFAGGALKLS